MDIFEGEEAIASLLKMQHLDEIAEVEEEEQVITEFEAMRPTLEEVEAWHKTMNWPDVYELEVN